MYHSRLHLDGNRGAADNFEYATSDHLYDSEVTTMDRPEKIKRVIVEAIGNPDGGQGEWKVVTFNRSNATQIAEAIYDALKSHGYLAESTT